MTPQKAAEIANARNSLIAICEHFQQNRNGQSSAAFHQDIADRLSALAGRKTPWTQRYIVSVKNGRVDPSQSMIWAIKALGYMIDDGHFLIAQSRPVDVLAYGEVTPGAVVLPDSRACAYVACNVVFVPRVPWQRYCCPDCRIKNYRMR